jgi:hypothetical protein
MKYINDIYFSLGIAWPVVGLLVVLIRRGFSSRAWLVSFLLLSLFRSVFSYILFSSIGNQEMSRESHALIEAVRKIDFLTVQPATYVCFLVFVFRFTSTQKTTGEIMTNTDPDKEPKPSASNPALGFILLILAPILYVILGLLLGARGLPDAIGNSTPISIAAALGCIVASIAAFAGKFRLK